MFNKNELPLKSRHSVLNEELVDISIKLLKLQIEFLTINKMDYDAFLTCAGKKVAFLQGMSKATTSSQIKKNISEVLKEYRDVLRD
jgi:hypothetical protein